MKRRTSERTSPWTSPRKSSPAGPTALAAEKAKGYSVQDCAAATQNILLAAHAKGLSAVWTTVFPQNAGAVRKLLGIPEDVVPFSCIPLGRPAGPAPRTASRFDETKVHRQAWGGRGGAQ